MNEDIIEELEDLKRQVELGITILKSQRIVVDLKKIKKENCDFCVGDFCVYRRLNRGHVYAD